MFDSCLRLAPNHLLPLAFCVSKRTLRSTREGFFYLLSPLPLPPLHELLPRGPPPRHGKRPYLHPLRSHNSARQTSEPLRPLLLALSIPPRGSSPSPSVKSRDNTLKNPLLLLFRFRFRLFSSVFRVFCILYSLFCTR